MNPIETAIRQDEELKIAAERYAVATVNRIEATWLMRLGPMLMSDALRHSLRVELEAAFIGGSKMAVKQTIDMFDVIDSERGT
jgi:hypothetical protein